MQARNWLSRESTSIKRGEFYVLTLSTLLGMYFMISSGNFLLFFIGLETASVPMAALVAFDKYKHNSAEAGAKYILSAVFASGLMLYGISLIYGTTGTLYFEDIPVGIDGCPLQIMAFVFFFAGMGFKISEDTAERVRLLTSAIYDILGCSGLIRIDYIITEGEKVNLLEINTTPGMTATSFIPQQVRAAGLDIKDVMTDIIENKF